ncbi:MAG: cation diffusion facilitator family transporter, partial [Pseudomonadota bacterium]|nr:cation diffusion facilitator family transporter [Pseudomonadota bacterium]
LTGWTPIDPILSVVVSLLVLRSAWKLAAKSLHILLEGAPDGAAPEKIERHLLEHVPGVAAVGHIHVWSITSGRTLATMHVRPTSDAEARVVVRAVERELENHFEIEHATVAVDWNEEGETCSLAPGNKRDNGHDHDHDHFGHSHGASGKACSH